MSMITTERGSSRSQPRDAKSASALLTVSREAPTSWASSSWVRSWCTCTPSSAVRPNRSARSSSALATRPGTSEKTRSATTSLALRSRPASWASRPRATRGPAVEPAQQVLVRQRGEGGVGDGGDRRRARAGVEQRQLAEHLARAEDRQQVLPAVGGGAAQLHLAVGDDVQLVALVALVEQHVPAAQPGVGHRCAQGGRGLVVEGAEQRSLAQHVVVHGGPPSSSVVGPRPSVWPYDHASRCAKKAPSVGRDPRLGHVPDTVPGPPRPQDRPGARRDLPRRALRARLQQPVRAARGDRAVGADHRPPGQRGQPRRCSPPTPTPRRWPAPSARSSRRSSSPPASSAPRPSRLLEAVAGPGRAPRRRGAAAAGRPGQAAGRRSQDRERGAGQRLRHPRHHRRHALRPARPPLRLDRGDRPGQGRARGRRAVPQAGLDDALPPPDLARPAGLPRAQPRLRRLPVARWCPAYGEGPTDPEQAAKLVKTEGRA